LFVEISPKKNELNKVEEIIVICINKKSGEIKTLFTEKMNTASKLGLNTQTGRWTKPGMGL
jgi:hypothetical protein